MLKRLLERVAFFFVTLLLLCCLFSLHLMSEPLQTSSTQQKPLARIIQTKNCVKLLAKRLVKASIAMPCKVLFFTVSTLVMTRLRTTKRTQLPQHQQPLVFFATYLVNLRLSISISGIGTCVNGLLNTFAKTQDAT